VQREIDILSKISIIEDEENREFGSTSIMKLYDVNENSKYLYLICEKC
jgi:hypothetical protein